MLQIFNGRRCMLYDLNIKFGYFWDTLCIVDFPEVLKKGSHEVNHPTHDWLI